jgi:hypothetical protein
LIKWFGSGLVTAGVAGRYPVEAAEPVAVPVAAGPMPPTLA